MYADTCTVWEVDAYLRFQFVGDFPQRQSATVKVPTSSLPNSRSPIGEQVVVLLACT